MFTQAGLLSAVVREPQGEHSHSLLAHRRNTCSLWLTTPTHCLCAIRAAASWQCVLQQNILQYWWRGPLNPKESRGLRDARKRQTARQSFSQPPVTPVSPSTSYGSLCCAAKLAEYKSKNGEKKLRLGAEQLFVCFIRLQVTFPVTHFSNDF